VPTDNLLGAFEELVLLAVVHLGADAYGMRVRREVEARTGRDVNIGAVYATLNRLETKDYLTSAEVSGPEARRGRPRRTFRLRPAGAAALREARHAARSMWEGVDPDALPEHGRA
jgi:PadR family transcriptional regulator PadR